MVERSVINSIVRRAIADLTVLTSIQEARNAAMAKLLAGEGEKITIGNVNGVYFQASESSMSGEEWFSFLDTICFLAEQNMLLPSRSTIRF
jgi:hypothetical protein